MRGLAVACVLGWTAIATADAGTKQVVLINAAPKLDDSGGVANVRRALDSRGVLAEVPPALQATLLGDSVAVENLDAIEEAFAKEDFAAALELIEQNEKRILDHVGSGDPTPALAQLSQWRGLVAVRQEDPTTAIAQFRAALRFNPGWSLDKKLAQPAVNRVIAKARKQVSESGKLRVDAEQADAVVAIDGGKAQPATEKLELPVGIHLVVVSAKGHARYAELVDIEADKLLTLPISLDPETQDDKAMRLGAATIEAPSGKARLDRAKRLARITSQTRYLVIEDLGDRRITLRVYDVGDEKVSRPVELEDNASSVTIYRKVMAALEPDNMMAPGSGVAMTDKAGSPRWYARWYVWAGVAALAGGGIIGYQHMTREPESIRF